MDRMILATVLREAPIGVVVLDPDLRVDRVSHVAESDGGLTAADNGRELLDAWPGVPDDVVAALRRVACGRATRVEMRSSSPDWRADHMTIAAATGPAGEVEYVVWMWADVTEPLPARRRDRRAYPVSDDVEAATGERAASVSARSRTRRQSS